jgi:hypothetical protein
MTIKKIHITFHIDEETGKVVKATKAQAADKEEYGEKAAPDTITEEIVSVLGHDSSSCYYVKINGQWVCFC